jgi:hypothetical protein
MFDKGEIKRCPFACNLDELRGIWLSLILPIIRVPAVSMFKSVKH